MDMEADIGFEPIVPIGMLNADVMFCKTVEFGKALLFRITVTTFGISGRYFQSAVTFTSVLISFFVKFGFFPGSNPNPCSNAIVPSGVSIPDEAGGKIVEALGTNKEHPAPQSNIMHKPTKKLFFMSIS
jgi:hypothetical protein